MKVFLALLMSIFLSGPVMADTLSVNGHKIGEGMVKIDTHNNLSFVFTDGSHILMSTCVQSGVCIVRFSERSEDLTDLRQMMITLVALLVVFNIFIVVLAIVDKYYEYKD